jgi:N6-adenosine-specific RNA methylase IME4
MDEIKWIYPCGSGWEYCDDGFCGRYNQLKEDHRRPAVEMSDEWLETTGKKWKPKSITKQFERLTTTKRRSCGTPKPEYETCAISDLERLINAGKKFGTIYADPPWRYENQLTRAATDKHYKGMTVKEIATLPISQLTLNKAHLHLWTTNAFLFDCPEIMEEWGFKYKGVFVWCKGAVEHSKLKPQMGIGNYWRVSHEFMILGVKGEQTFFDKSQVSWMLEKRGQHSRKPESVAEIIEKVSSGPYLELFGRRVRDNWTVWGNEIEKDLFNKAAFKNI